MKVIKVTPADDLQDILNNIDGPATICLAEGIYRRKIEITRPNIILRGEKRETTVISYDDYARKIHADGKEYNTFRTYTLCVSAEGVRLENLTVENTNTDPKNVGQCVALSVNAKTFSAENCDLKSTQDTLFVAPFPDDLTLRYRDFLPARQLYIEGGALHTFSDCRIFGTVDFIFGCARAIFYRCELISLDDGRNGFIAAPAHPLAEDTGFVFLDCNLVSGGAARASVFLSRPWRDFGKSVFINCALGGHISPLLFDKWNDTSRDKSARFLYYGLKADFPLSPVKWARELSSDEAQKIADFAKDAVARNR